MRTRLPPSRSAARAFTLTELLVVLAIGAILAATAVPSLRDALVAQRLRAAGTDLVSSLLLARSEAIKRNANVTVQPLSGTSWADGWTVVSDAGAALDRRDALGARVAVTLAPATIVYTPSGRLLTAGTSRVQIADAYGQPGITPRCVTIDTSGVPKLAAATCP